MFKTNCLYCGGEAIADTTSPHDHIKNGICSVECMDALSAQLFAALMALPDEEFREIDRAIRAAPSPVTPFGAN